MSEVSFAVGDADAGLRERLDEETYARFGYTECGRTPGYPQGYDEIHLMKKLC